MYNYTHYMFHKYNYIINIINYIINIYDIIYRYKYSTVILVFLFSIMLLICPC